MSNSASAESAENPGVESNLPASQLTFALIGNPNTGKSTLFNALAGMKARVGNYPGVTVEKKVGNFQYQNHKIELIDLPGTYSLSPRTADEMVSVRVLLGSQEQTEIPDAAICIVDATHLQRHLYLLCQLLGLGLPTILVLNMWDEVQKQKLEIDVKKLEQRLGIPVVAACARSGLGVPELKEKMIALIANHQSTDKSKRNHLELFPENFQLARAEISKIIQEKTGQQIPEYLAERLLLDINGETEREVLKGNEAVAEILRLKREELKQNGCPIPAIEPRVRYGWAREMLGGIIQQPELPVEQRGDYLDRWLTHRIWGPAVFAVIMLLMFQAIYTWAGPLMDGIEIIQDAISRLITGAMSPGALRSLLTDGIVGGVGSVVVFLPQILILFLFIAILEDCGYMSRAAFLMDRIMTKVGLSGKAFVPMISSFACAVPGIMAARTIEDRKERFVTILVAPLMSCSARLPVYLLMINAFIPQQSIFGGFVSLQAFVLFCFYLLGVLVAIPVAWILKKTWFKGEVAPFVMELPNFKWPSFRVVFYRVWDRGRSFLKQAGTLIFLTTIIVWAAGYFPGDRTELNQVMAQLESENLSKEDTAREVLQERSRELSSQLLNDSFLGTAGHFIEPVVEPLGWDWRIGMGAIASFPAREVIIGTLGTIYSLGGDVNEEDTGLMAKMHSARKADGTPVYNVPVALSVMVFFALCAQCGATLMVMRQETNSWKWPLFSFTYMTTLAYLGAWTTYQIGIAILPTV